MPDDPKSRDSNKFRRYRASRKAQGLKLVRIWLPDPHAPGFREEADRQAALLRGRPEQEEAQHFIEQAGDFTGWDDISR